MTAADISDAQRKGFVRLKAAEFSEFLKRIEDDTNDAQLIRHLYGLFFIMYEMNSEKRYMTKSHACRFIPLKHASSCQKYLDEAAKRGYVVFERDRNDSRKIVVKPGAMLIEFVDAEIEKGILTTMQAISPRSRSYLTINSRSR